MVILSDCGVLTRDGSLTAQSKPRKMHDRGDEDWFYFNDL